MQWNLLCNWLGCSKIYSSGFGYGQYLKYMYLKYYLKYIEIFCICILNTFLVEYFCAYFKYIWSILNTCILNTLRVFHQNIFFSFWDGMLSSSCKWSRTLINSFILFMNSLSIVDIYTLIPAYTYEFVGLPIMSS